MLILCIASSLVVLASFADDSSVQWSYESYGDGVVLTEYLGNKADVYVPSTIEADGKTLSVLKLGDGLFENNDGINSVTLGAGIAEIGDRVFYDCDKLVCVLVSEELTTIGDEAFSGCDIFNSVILYDGVESIGTDAFSDCPKLTVWCSEGTVAYSYVLSHGVEHKLLAASSAPETVELDGLTYYIQNGGAYLVASDRSITAFSVPATVNGFPVVAVNEAFRDNDTVVSVTLPEGLKSIGAYAFYDCGALTTVNIPESLTFLGDYAFYKCTKLASKIVIPAGIEAVRDYVFYYCSSITEVVISASVKKIGPYAFNYCSAILTLEIPEGVQSIGSSAFSGCSGLVEISIPGSITAMGDYVFAYCYGVTKLTLGDGIKVISANSFRGCRNLKDLTIPGSVGRISDNAFYECKGLENVTICEGVTRIGSYSFRDCIKLSSLTIPSTVTSLGSYAFGSCGELQSVVIPEGVETISQYAFQSCVKLQEITLPSTVISIGNGVFQYCSSLKSATINASIAVLNANVFGGCAMLSSVTLPEGLVTLNSGAFSGCTRLRAVVIPASVTNLQDGAFPSSTIFAVYEGSAGETYAKNYNRLYTIYDGVNLPEIIETEDGFVYYVMDGEAYLLAYEGTATEVTVPDEVNGYDVLHVLEAFRSNTTITKVTLPSNLKTIGAYSFYNCTKLTSVNFPSSLVTVGAYAFYGCTSLVSDVVIPQGVKVIGFYAFYNCNKITNLTISNGVETIGEYAFSNCSRINGVAIPSSVKIVSRYAFYYCSAISTLTIGTGVETIGEYAFCSLSKISELVLPDSLKTMGEYAFSNCALLVNVKLSSGLSLISPNCFSSCNRLQEIVIPEGVKTIGAMAFQSCASLKSVTLPAGLEKIVTRAFNNCPKLRMVVIPSTVTSISTDAFPTNTAFAVYKDTYGESFAETNGRLYAIYDGVNLPEIIEAEDGCIYFIMSGEAYLVAYEGTATEITVPAKINGYSVVSVLDAFRNNDKIKTVTLPEGLLIIGAYAFYDCDALTTVNLPESLTSIGDYAFYDCGYLKSDIVISANVKNIGNCAFYYCRYVKNLTLSSGIETIGNFAFYCCYSIEQLTIPSSVKSIGNYAFDSCSSLSTLTISDGVTSIDYNAFSNSGIVSVVIPGSLKNISNYMFANCKSLETVVISDGVEKIGYYAFEKCSSLKTLVIAPSVTVIGAYSFSGCSALSSVVIPNGVSIIEARAFLDCKGLTEILIPQSVIGIGYAAFSGCTSLTSVVFTEGLDTLESLAFSGCTSLRFLLIPSSVMVLDVSSIPTSTILLVHKDSHAHTFAESNNMLYHVLTRSENPNIAYGESITGTVKDSFGNAIAGATVELYYTNGELKDRVTTDSNGNYTFSYAEVDSYIIVATDGYGNAGQGSARVSRIDVFSVSVSGDRDIVLRTSYSISGTLSAFPAKVTVIDERGNIVKTFESTDGNFNIVGIVRGEYTVSASTAKGYGAVHVTVYNSDVSDVHIDIAENTVTVSGAVVIAGRDGALTSAPYVQVSIYDANGKNIATAKTDSEGKYQFVNLPIGTYSIVATAAELRPDKNYGYDRLHTLTGYASVSASEGGEIAISDIVMRERTDDATASVEGKVTAEGETQNCTVILTNANGDEIATYKTGKNGKFKFVNLPDGKYTVTAITGSNGVGSVEVVISGGESASGIHIKVAKSSKVVAMEAQFSADVPILTSKEEAELYRDRISAEKNAYDALSKKEKKELTAEYVERLEKYVAWLAECEVKAPEGVVIEQGGLIVSGDEIANGDKVSFELNLEATDAWVQNPDGVETEQDHLCNMVQDAAGDRSIVQYYEITMLKTLNGVTSSVTDVYKDTDAGGKFRITLPIPAEYLGFITYAMVHVHNGEITTLMDYDDDPTTITIEVDKFSTFVLIAGNTELTEEVPCEHDYDNDCDSVCNWCEESREVSDHVYDNACDADCNVCGDEREVGDHVYDNACDADCNVCGDEREVGDHVFGDWQVVKEPTTTEEGEREASCTECGETKRESIEKLPEAPEEPETPDEPGESTIPEAPEEPEEELGFFAKIWKAIVDFFRALFGIKTEE